MKVIFLDFDGVLNSVDFHTRQHAAGEDEKPRPRHLEPMLDPAAIQVLNEVIEKTGAVIVVSSTWRKGERRVWLQEQLTKRGLKGTVIDVTPDLGTRRGLEIQQWLDGAACFPRGRLGPVTHFCILDDDTDMEHLYDKLVHIDDQLGLTREYMPAILRHLGYEEPAYPWAVMDATNGAASCDSSVAPESAKETP